MTPERLKEIMERAKAATKPPWTYGNVDSIQVCCDGIVNEETREVIYCNSGRGATEPTDEDLAFILASRQDIPDLLDYIAELQRHKPVFDYCQRMMKLLAEVQATRNRSAVEEVIVDFIEGLSKLVGGPAEESEHYGQSVIDLGGELEKLEKEGEKE